MKPCSVRSATAPSRAAVDRRNWACIAVMPAAGRQKTGEKAA
jgi:hypothetical protein